MSSVFALDGPDIVIGVSPAFGRPGTEPALSGLTAREIVVSLVQGATMTGCGVRMVRVNHSVDLVRIAWEAAQLAPSGVGLGILAKGTVVIHSTTHALREVVELSAPANLLDRTAYRSLGMRAARLAKGVPAPTPEPTLLDPDLVVQFRERVRSYGHVERGWCRADPPVEELTSLE